MTNQRFAVLSFACKCWPRCLVNQVDRAFWWHDTKNVSHFLVCCNHNYFSFEKIKFLLSLVLGSRIAVTFDWNKSITPLFYCKSIWAANEANHLPFCCLLNNNWAPKCTLRHDTEASRAVFGSSSFHGEQILLKKSFHRWIWYRWKGKIELSKIVFVVYF